MSNIYLWVPSFEYRQLGLDIEGAKRWPRDLNAEINWRRKGRQFAQRCLACIVHAHTRLWNTRAALVSTLGRM